METFDLGGARRAAAAGRLLEWTVAKVMREGRANRPLAAILRSQKPLLSGPTLVPLAGLERIAGGEPHYKYPVPMAQWEREVAPMLASAPEDQPPVLLRYGNHVSDGNHRVDAAARRGETHVWAILWEDSDPVWKDCWGPFLPDVSPTFGVVESAEGFLPPVDAEGTVFAARSRERIVGAFRLVPEFGGLTLRTMLVHPEWRGKRLGSRMLRVARPLMDGQVVHCLAYPSLARFYGEVGFLPVDPTALPEGLWARYALMQDERGCVALRREP